MTYLDTHVVVALYQGEVGAFRSEALEAIERDDDLRISPMVVLELQYLREIRRVKVPADRILKALASEIGLIVCEAPFGDVVRKALAERWTRDPFDRIIVAQARLAQAALITRDRQIQARYKLALG